MLVHGAHIELLTPKPSIQNEFLKNYLLEATEMENKSSKVKDYNSIGIDGMGENNYLKDGTNTKSSDHIPKVFVHEKKGHNDRESEDGPGSLNNFFISM
ncbi:unnamed protein product [Lepeophtheirus salmonis]|uniref:(salmon louse) hypothetical protein n=1 Tax=Lepeophtheirus salmonis TaxID=72036 RepID=A0A7R8H7N4_LEPSM|nr:unnamed protein product [Lepeophtheirus salmonis]CAF2921909.1 unnamed protein product [Lepeophtheirus salmonis]